MSLTQTIKQERHDRIELAIRSYIVHLVMVDDMSIGEVMLTTGRVVAQSMHNAIRSALIIIDKRRGIENKDLDEAEEAFAAEVTRRRKST